MCELQKLLDGLSLTFNKYKELRRLEMIDIINKLRCCQCGHRMRMAAIGMVNGKTEGEGEGNANKCPESQVSNKRKLLIGLGFVLSMIPVATIILARRYNHYQSHGSGACVSSFLYTFTDDCEVIF
ncbi:uncharacterized protein LOC111076603 [Drosophila obscura]|uniref:uncharacterized protein LOC111076603 n=1 Tax=Drosophila obscura TaxID=7282 RepID=UPI000B9FD615|nr:uncharacterized protein LOC111076603 [Drosophila obscura]